MAKTAIGFVSCHSHWDCVCKISFRGWDLADQRAKKERRKVLYEWNEMGIWCIKSCRILARLPESCER